MHDKFENEVQKKMEELRLTPSAPVWEKIEMEIQPEKRRRKVFFWLFFGLLLSGGAFLAYQLTGNKQPVTVQASIPASNQTSEAEDKRIKRAEKPGPIEVEKTVDKTNTSIAEKEQQPYREEKKTNTASYTQQVGQRISKISTTNRQIQKTKKENTERKPQEPATIVKSNNEVSITKEQPSSSETRNEAVKPADRWEVIERPKPADSLAKQPEEKNELPKAIDSSLKRKVATSKGWRKQIQFSIGLSDYMTVPSTKAMSSMDANYQSSVGSAAPIFYRPAETKGNFAFTAGFSMAKKLSEHFEIAVGLQYAYYSTRTNVGNRLQNDTLLRYANTAFSAGSFYTNASTGSYTNRFHVAEIPVTISYKPSVNLPLFVSVGAAYGRIVATNALTFSNRNNVYFENKEAYVRNILPLSSSVQVELFSKKKMSLRLGPVIQYNLLKLQKEATEGERHLFFAGIKSSVNF